MRNKLLPFIFATITLASQQLSLANCAPNCYSTDPCCPSNWYVAASGSVAWHNDHKFTSTSGIEIDIATREYKIGYGAAASLGYIFNLCNCWNLRLEGEVVWRRNSLKNETLTFVDENISTTRPANGYTQDIALMANLITDFPLFCDLNGYVGGGLGISFNQLDMSSVNGISQSPSKKSNELFAWQVMAGLAYNFCPNVALTAGYRLFATEKVTTPQANIKSNKIPLTQSIDIGLRIRL